MIKPALFHTRLDVVCLCIIQRRHLCWWSLIPSKISLLQLLKPLTQQIYVCILHPASLSMLMIFPSHQNHFLFLQLWKPLTGMQQQIIYRTLHPSLYANCLYILGHCKSLWQSSSDCAACDAVSDCWMLLDWAGLWTDTKSIQNGWHSGWPVFKPVWLCWSIPKSCSCSSWMFERKSLDGGTHREDIWWVKHHCSFEGQARSRCSKHFKLNKTKQNKIVSSSSSFSHPLAHSFSTLWHHPCFLCSWWMYAGN